MQVAGITYDSVEQQLKFAAEADIEFPLLSDQEVAHVDAYGVRNEEYEAGHKGYGIPYPGVFYFDADQVIRAKFAITGYRQRPPMAEILGVVGALQDD